MYFKQSLAIAQKGGRGKLSTTELHWDFGDRPSFQPAE